MHRYLAGLNCPPLIQLTLERLGRLGRLNATSLSKQAADLVDRA
ncbi:MAG: hypothetical protein WCC36_08780 [Gammaproteobacteria bacterium]